MILCFRAVGPSRETSRSLRRNGKCYSGKTGCLVSAAYPAGEDTHWPGDVLDLVLAHVLEREGELVAHLVAHHVADADATRLRQGFQPSGNVDAVAEDVLPIDDDVAKIDADAEIDARFGRHIGIRPSPAAPRPRTARR
jgi:hypothetical protein